MTYQVSYCIYTAATVEALELKSASLTTIERSLVAERLLAAVMTLQNEASHTPGSGKSLDTIRRLLSEGPPQAPAQNQSQDPRRRKRMRRDSDDHGSERGGPREAVHDNEMEKAHRASVVGSTDNPRTRTKLATLADVAGSVRLDSGGAPKPGIRDTDAVVQTGADTGAALRTGAGTVAAASQVQQWSGASGLSTVPRQPPNSNNGAGQGTENMSVWDSDLGISWNTDTGAGFHPDAFSWGLTDDFPRFPPLPNAGLATGPASSTPYPSFANNQSWYGL